jgi:hypothetical protein
VSVVASPLTGGRLGPVSEQVQLAEPGEALGCGVTAMICETEIKRGSVQD